MAERLPLGMGRMLTPGAEAAAFTQFLWERRDVDTSGESVSGLLRNFCVCYALASSRRSAGKFLLPVVVSYRVREPPLSRQGLELESSPCAEPGKLKVAQCE